MNDELPATRQLLAIMRRLRDPRSGCPWDRAQDERSLARYTLEEAYELVDALERMAAELPQSPHVFVTGGDLRQLAPLVSPEARFVPHMVLAGIRLAFKP